jgi:hypothetical protein
LTSVLYVGADTEQEKNCTIWNCYNPTKAINKLSNHKASCITVPEFVQNNPEVQKKVEESDIIVIERNLFQDTMTMTAYWTARNKAIIGIWDDSYDHMESTNVSFNFWEKGQIKYTDENQKEQIGFMLPPPLTQFKLTLKLMKGAQVVSKTLAEDWKKYTPTYHINNYLDIDRYKDAKPLYSLDRIILLWQGSLSHHASFANSGIIGGLEKICKKYPKVMVLLGGDRRNFDLLKNIPQNQKIYSPFVPEEQYSSLIKTATIGLAPLATDYDKRRSWIKCLEYSYLKKPWIASNYPPYEELSPYGKLIENGANSWFEGLSEMIDHLPQYQEKANTISYDFACQQNIDLKIQSTLDLYQKIIDSPHNI